MGHLDHHHLWRRRRRRWDCHRDRNRRRWRRRHRYCYRRYRSYSYALTANTVARRNEDPQYGHTSQHCHDLPEGHECLGIDSIVISPSRGVAGVGQPGSWRSSPCSPSPSICRRRLCDWLLSGGSCCWRHCRWIAGASWRRICRVCHLNFSLEPPGAR